RGEPSRSRRECVARALFARSRLRARPALSDRLLPRGRLPARNEDPRLVVPRAARPRAGRPRRRSHTRQGGAIPRERVFGSAWRRSLLAASGLTLLGAVLVVFFVREGPFAPAPARFDVTQVTKVFANQGVRLASFGYFGHMWELYAMWTWVPVMLRSGFALRGLPPAAAEAASFFVIGCGAAGCVPAGPAAAQKGRTLVTAAAMAATGGG